MSTNIIHAKICNNLWPSKSEDVTMLIGERCRKKITATWDLVLLDTGLSFVNFEEIKINMNNIFQNHSHSFFWIVIGTLRYWDFHMKNKKKKNQHERWWTWVKFNHIKYTINHSFHSHLPFICNTLFWSPLWSCCVHSVLHLKQKTNKKILNSIDKNKNIKKDIHVLVQ